MIEAAINFIAEQQDEPFFLLYSDPVPHAPNVPSERFQGTSQRGDYGDVIHKIDWQVQQLMTALKKLDLENDTIVVFTSDNGPWLIMNENGGNALPLFDRKMTTFEGGQRVPCVMKWPARIPAGKVCDELAATIDLLPTFAAIMGAALLMVQPLDGKDILELLTNEAGAESPYQFFFQGQAAVRQGDWKYHAREHFKVQETARKHRGPTLYNLKNHIGESHNVINEYPDIAEHLAKVLESNPNRCIASEKDRSRKKKGKKK